jgi:hypothetical protein
MSQSNLISRIYNGRRFLILFVSAVALWLILPFVFQLSSSRSEAQTATVAPDLVAVLTGTATGNVVPSGVALYDSMTVGGTTTRVLDVEVSNVVLPIAATPATLSVFLNDTNIGSMTLDPLRHGMLHLTTANGGTVPTPVAGDTVSVKNGNATVLSGAFVTPPPPPPTPISHLFAPMAAPVAAATLVPRGLGEYTAFSATVRQLEVYVANVNLPDGAILNIGVAGSPVGQIVIHGHAGVLRLSTVRGDTVPVIAAGDPIAARNAGAVILAGVFAVIPPPPPPHPQAFAAKLNGRHEVPPVTTDGRGFGFVLLNPAGNGISVRLAFNHLSSAVTSVTINGPATPDANGPVIFTLNNGGTVAGTPPQAFPVTPQQAVQLRNGLWYFQVSTTGNPTGEIRGQIRPVNGRADFDGDGVSDISVVRPRVGLAPDNAANDWYTLNSSTNTFTATSIGHPGDVPVQGDYDGDGISDIAMYSPSTGTWQIVRSGTGSMTLPCIVRPRAIGTFFEVQTAVFPVSIGDHQRTGR